MSNTVAKFLHCCGRGHPVASFASSADRGRCGIWQCADQWYSAGPGKRRWSEQRVGDPSGIGNASRIAPLPPPRITVPVVPQFK